MLRLEPPSPPLADGAVRLEPLTLMDVDDMGALADDPDVARFTYVPAPLPEDFGRQWVERYVSGWKEGTLAGIAVRPSWGEEFLGFAAVVRFDGDGREGELGFIVAPAARGRGVASRALILLSRWALGPVGLERVELRIDAENAGSLRVAERAGFLRECVLRSVHLKHGIRIDQAVYSLLASDVEPS